MLTSPPILMQVEEPSTLTKPGPYAAHEWSDVERLSGSRLPEAVMSDFWRPDCSAAVAAMPVSSSVVITSRNFRIRPFSAPRQAALADEFDADRLAAAPHHFAAAPRPRVAR